jgi:hypothetical protein
VTTTGMPRRIRIAGRAAIRRDFMGWQIGMVQVPPRWFQAICLAREAGSGSSARFKGSGVGAG